MPRGIIATHSIPAGGGCRHEQRNGEMLDTTDAHSEGDATRVGSHSLNPSERTQMPKTKTINLINLELSPAMQARTAIKEGTVQDYAEAMESGAKFPPITVMAVNGSAKAFCVIDGWHRVQAARACGKDSIACEVIDGTTSEDAMWAAAGMNISHGLRRSNADKARAVSLALQVRPDATYEEIASHCGVSVSMVASYFNAMNEVAAADEAIADEETETDTRVEVVQELTPVQQRMMSAVTAIGAAVQTLEDAHEIVANLTESNEGAYVNAQSVLSDLTNAIGALKHAAPYRECPLCNGEGCETCRMLGWVSKKQWQLIPAEMRGEAPRRKPSRIPYDTGDGE